MNSLHNTLTINTSQQVSHLYPQLLSFLYYFDANPRYFIIGKLVTKWQPFEDAGYVGNESPVRFLILFESPVTILQFIKTRCNKTTNTY